MSAETRQEITLRVPGEMAYALVIRTALGGVAILKDLSVGAMDDLRTAADEACDCLLHQKCGVQAIQVKVAECGDCLAVSLEAEPNGSCSGGADPSDISRAVLETLVPEVELHRAGCGCISRIDLKLPRSV